MTLVWPIEWTNMIYPLPTTTYLSSLHNICKLDVYEEDNDEYDDASLKLWIYTYSEDDEDDFATERGLLGWYHIRFGINAWERWELWKSMIFILEFSALVVINV